MYLRKILLLLFYLMILLLLLLIFFFPVVKVEPIPKPYLDGLMPRDQVFEEEEERTRKKKRRIVNEDGELQQVRLPFW